MSIRIGIAGITGRMGKLLTEEVAAAGATLAGGLRRGEDPASLFAGSDVVIDYTNPAAAIAHAAADAASGSPLVPGSSGLSSAREAPLADTARQVAIVYAANFAPGVNLVLAMAERMAAA